MEVAPEIEEPAFVGASLPICCRPTSQTPDHIWQPQHEEGGSSRQRTRCPPWRATSRGVRHSQCRVHWLRERTMADTAVPSTRSSTYSSRSFRACCQCVALGPVSSSSRSQAGPHSSSEPQSFGGGGSEANMPYPRCRPRINHSQSV